MKTDTQRRPADRKDTVAAVARELFAAHGFGDVRMEDIATQIGITSRALYRHYSSKQALLAHIITESQRRFITVLEAQDMPFEVRLRGLAEASLDSPHLSILWQREARYLAPEDFDTVRSNMTWMVDRLDIEIRSCWPDLDTAETSVRAWAVLAILSSPGHQTVTMARPQFRDLLVGACRAALSTPPRERSTAPSARRRRLPLLSRREQILEAAARAFRQSGFTAVGISEIGAAAGLVGPAVYRYFSTKTDILVALIARHLEWSEFCAFHVRQTEDPDNPEVVFRQLLTHHARLSVEVPDLVGVTVSEWLQLPAGAESSLRRILSDQHNERAHWLAAARPELSTADAVALEHIASILITDSARVAPIMPVPDLSGRLADLAATVCLATNPQAKYDRQHPTLPST